MLARHYLEQGEAAAALGVAADYACRFPTNSMLALLHAKALVATQRYQAAVDRLNSLDLLPCEGSTEAHSLFREAHLMLAVARMKAGAFIEAQQLIDRAREWPEHLGAGKPYAQEIDERLEDWLSYQSALGNKASDQARQSLERLLVWRPRSDAGGSGEIIRALALKERRQTNDAQQLLEARLKKDPDSEPARWGLKILAGDSGALPPKLQDSTSRVFAAWLRSLQPQGP